MRATETSAMRSRPVADVARLRWESTCTLASSATTRRPQLGAVRRRIVVAGGQSPRFDAHIRRDVATAVFEAARRAARVVVARLDEIFNDKAGPAKPTEQLFPPMKEL